MKIDWSQQAECLKWPQLMAAQPILWYSATNKNVTTVGCFWTVYRKIKKKREVLILLQKDI